MREICGAVQLAVGGSLLLSVCRSWPPFPVPGSCGRCGTYTLYDLLDAMELFLVRRTGERLLYEQ